MKFIEEIVVEDFLPTVRSMLAEELRERGLTQREVADALGISQSAVSKYAHGEVARHPAVVGDDRVQSLVDEVSEGLATGEMSRVRALVEIEVLIRRLETGDVLAALHEEAMPELSEFDGPLSIHDPESPLRTVEQVRSSVRRGLRTLTSASGFAPLIPNVGSNLVECLPDAEGIEDVAGVPGRIFDIKGQTTVPGDPEFGVSEHVASVLLAARAAGHPVRGALNVRYDPDLIDGLSTTGVECVEFDPESADDEADAMRAALTDRDLEVPFACYQRGGYGIEPITYVLAADAPSAASVVREHL